MVVLGYSLGSSVRIIKKHDTIAIGIEREVGSELIRALENDGISFLIGRDIKEVYKRGKIQNQQA